MDISLTEIISLISVVLGGGVLFYRQDRKQKELANEVTAIGEWKELYNELKNENKELNSKIDELYGKIEHHRDEKTELRNTILKNTQKIADLELNLLEVSQWKCEVRQCSKRRPPSPITMIDNETDN